MKRIFIYLAMSLLAFLPFFPAEGQNPKKEAAITADSLASGNYKDVLTSFFQIAFDKLTGKNKELKFSSNPYAIMMRADPDLEYSNAYKRNKVLRNINFNFNIKLDTSYHFNGFSSGISYAIINRRDHTVYNEFLDAVMLKNNDFHNLNLAVAKKISSIQDDQLADKVTLQVNQLFNDEKFTFDKLDEDVKGVVLEILKDVTFKPIADSIKKNQKLNFRGIVNKNYETVKKLFQNRLLWTVAVSDTTYKDDFLFSNLVFSSQVLKGISNPDKRSNIEINIKTALNLLDDTQKGGRDLKRSVFSFEPGLNWVLKSKQDKPMIEFMFSGSYIHIFSGAKTNEDEDSIHFNGTFRVRIIGDIWIPLQFKYDPDSGNVFGFLSVKLNFNGQGKK